MKHLKEDKVFLTKNEISFKDVELKNRISTKNRLLVLLQQKPNTKFLVWKRENVYLRTTQKDKDNAFRRWKLKNIAEEPAIYDTLLTQDTRLNFENFLASKGYFDAEVEYNEKFKGDHVSVEYVVEQGKRYTIENFYLRSNDDNIQKLLDSTYAQSYLKAPAPVDRSLYLKEVGRITSLLKNSGYAFFQPSSVDKLELERNGNKVTAYLNVLNDFEENHNVYNIGEIKIDPFFSPTKRDSMAEYREFKDLQIKDYPEDKFIKDEVLRNAIILNPGKIYKKGDLDRTYKNLNNLSAYRFTSIKPLVDETNKIIDYKIELAPNFLWVFGSDLDFNFATVGSGRFLVGSSGAVNLTNRNLLGGSELFQTSAQVFGELDLRRADNKLNSFSISSSSRLDIPRFVDGFNLFKSIRNIRLKKNKKLWDDNNFKRFSDQTKSSFLINYNFNSLVDFYQYHSVDLKFSHIYQPNKRNKLEMVQTGISLFDVTPLAGLDSITKNNVFLENSFRDRLITRFIIPSAEYSHLSRTNELGMSWGMNLNAALSGLEVHAVNVITSGAKNPVTIGNLELAQFAKLEVDFLFSKEFRKNNSFASRINMGLVRPFGVGKYADDVSINVPYIAQFFVGGPQSIRAWQFRELGPGGYIDPLFYPPSDETTNQPFYQSGDIKLVFNLEYRFDIFWLFEGAVFLDGGNIWTVNDSRENATFNSQFLDQIAIGTGYGVRVDFTYFMLRLDMGFKMRTPFIQDGESSRWVFDNINDLSFKKANLNLSLGYPF